MKIEKITENKVRIILNFDEMEKNNIDFLSLTQDTEMSKELFKRLLKAAEKEIDFNFDDSRLLIEAFISPDGFFIITFTKLFDEIDSPIGKPLKIRAKKTKLLVKHYIYKFNTFDEFIDFCTFIANSSFEILPKKVSLYEHNFNYYLIFLSKYDENISFILNSITEFASFIDESSVLNSKLFEYGNIIFKNNALKKGIDFFTSNINPL